MKIVFTFAACIDGKGSQPEELIRLDSYLDFELADLGICGGEIHVLVHHVPPQIQVVFWAPDSISTAQIEKLRLDTIAQMVDGAGEGGFDVAIGKDRVIVWPQIDEPVVVETQQDWTVTVTPPVIAIAARDGDAVALARAIQADRSNVNQRLLGYTPLQLAILYGRCELVDILLEAGADPNLVGLEGGSALLRCAIANSLNDSQSCRVAQSLFMHGAKFTQDEQANRAPIQFAILRDKLQLSALFTKNLS